MCLLIKKELRETAKKTATEDITVYKCLEFENEQYISPSMGFEYELNKPYQTKIEFDGDYCSADDEAHKYYDKICAPSRYWRQDTVVIGSARVV